VIFLLAVVVDATKGRGERKSIKRCNHITAKTRQVGMFVKEKRSHFTVCESLNITFTANNLPAR